MKFEEQYEDVLQNIEAVIVEAYKADQSMLDYNVMRALQAAIEDYKAENLHRLPKPASLDEKDKEIYKSVRQICEWRLGRVAAEPGEDPAPPPISVDEILQCLKRILKSVEFWNREHGRQGYLNYIQSFM
jgi:hypothetical protein